MSFPWKIINILMDSNMNSHKQYCVCHNGALSNWFNVMAGVRRGCLLSQTLFIVIIDWVMRKAIADRPRGLIWKLERRLENRDFGDDNALLSHTHKDRQDKTNKGDSIASSDNLKIYLDNTKIIQVNSKNNQRVLVREIEV